MTLLTLPLAIPLAAALLTALPLPRRGRHGVGVAAGIALLLSAVAVFVSIGDAPLRGLRGYLFADAVSGFFLLVVGVVGAAVTAYLPAYLDAEAAQRPGQQRLGRFYALIFLFLFAVSVVCLTDNLGLLWVGIEATTLASAFLVAHSRSREALEAAWKYLILCSVGIAFAFLGTILVYGSAARLLASPTLAWQSLMDLAPQFNPQLMRLGFVFVLIGYGTKVGLAPLHTWLPDAHSQAPSPVSALLSGLLLNCSFYGLLRYHSLASRTLGPDFSGNLLLAMGLLSLAVALPFIVVQRDFKRLLAYSSVEHMGVIAVGFGLGGGAAFGALLHLLNHSLTKTLLFLSGGAIQLTYGSRKIRDVHGLLGSLPVTGMVFLLGGLALTGLPPFGIFLSELYILKGGLEAGRVWPALTFLILLVAIFVGFAAHLLRMCFGSAPAGVTPPRGRTLQWIPAALLGLAVVPGLHVPEFLRGSLAAILKILGS